MCGISAILSAEPHDISCLLRMHEPIRHRGPDGEGFLAITPSLQVVRAQSAGELLEKAGALPIVASVAFRWLKIQDVTEKARQPMASDDATVWITLNGEIYNFKELRTELEAAGARFVTHSDTEVALAAYRVWGEDCFHRFNGMWAIVVVDLLRRRIVISRDRVGIKPLFESTQNGRLLLASEAKQIVRASEGKPRADLDSVARHVAGDRPQPGHTFFEGIRAFPAATTATLTIGAAPQLVPRRYWSIDSADRVDDYAQAVTEADALLQSAVSLELIAEVGVGTLLSGGLDSSLVTAIGARSGRWPAFSFVLPSEDDRRLDESRYMDAVAAQYGVTVHKTTMDANWVATNLERVTSAQESPLTGMPVMAQYRTHELAASHGVRVVLDGQGADEVFAGYLRHQSIYLNEMLRSGKPGQFINELGAMTRRDRTYPVRYLRAGVLSPLREIVAPAHRRQPPWFRGKTSNEAREKPLDDRSLLNRSLFRDVTRVNIPTVLGITDRNSMAHSLEARVPLLDHRLIEFAFRLPSSFKIGSGLRKRILRSVAERYLPAAIINRTDSLGFGTPQSKWLEKDLASLVQDAVNDEIFTGLFDREAMRRERSPGRKWTILALRAWLRTFDVRLG